MKLSIATLAAIAASQVGASAPEAQLSEIWGEAWPFQGINTFAHLPSHNCLANRDSQYDIALVGVPFDTAVSYRPGARFGPRAIRAASQRQTSLRGFNPRALYNPYKEWASVVDCGDIPVSPMDNNLAFEQMTTGFEELLFEHSSKNDVAAKPRYIALGGDHSVLLPHIRALHKLYGPINIIHFDAHLDTWKPDKYPSYWHSAQSEVTHGSMLWKAYEEGLTTKNNVHAGLRTKLSGAEDWDDDDEQGWLRISADDVWLQGADHVIKQILKRIPKNSPTYISVDIDVLDPAFASGTGTQEPGGWQPRELIHILRGIESLNIVGADVVEVSPAYDHAEVTATNGAQVAYEIITSMAKSGPLKLPTAKGLHAEYSRSKSAFEAVDDVEFGYDAGHKDTQEALSERAMALEKRLAEIRELQKQNA
ncbi:agmatinase [Candidozyma auris]|nr:agmatinase [[Candida] auris]